LDRIQVKAGTSNQPGDLGVRVPHVTNAEVIAAPDEERLLGSEPEHALDDRGVGAQPLRTVDCLVEVRNDPALPATKLVAESVPLGEPVSTNGTDPHDSALLSVGTCGRLLDRVIAGRGTDHQGRVI